MTCTLIFNTNVFSFQGDFVVERSRKPKLTAHDKFLKKFEYTKALDSVLEVPDFEASMAL